MALKRAAFRCIEQEWEGRKICFCTDSQSTLQGLQNPRFTSLLLLKLYRTLVKLAQTNTVKLLYVPGHIGLKGNEEADGLARRGAEVGEQRQVTYNLPLAKSVAKSAIKEWLTSITNEFWINTGCFRQSHFFMDRLSIHRSKYLLQLSRVRLKMAIAILTGHARVFVHLHRLKIVNTNICPLCETEPEDIEHFFCWCKKLCTLRVKLFQERFCNIGDLRAFSVAQLLEFAEKSGRFNSAYEQDILEQYKIQEQG